MRLAMKPGRVLRAHDRLAEADVGEGFEAGQRARIGRVVGDDLKQTHVARRVEEVGDEKARPQPLVHALLQRFERQGRGVRRDERAWPDMLGELGVEVALDLDPLDHRLDHPVAVPQPLQVVLDVAGYHPPGGGLAHEGGRVGLEQLLHRRLGDGVAVGGTLRDDVEQVDFDAGVGDLRRDGGPHDAGADDGGARDPGGHHSASRTVAIPCPPPMHMVASA